MEHLHIDFYVKALTSANRSGQLAALHEEVQRLLKVVARVGLDSAAAKVAAEHAAHDGPAPTKPCPECARAMIAVRSEGVEADICGVCRGLWFDKTQLLHYTDGVDDTPDLDYATRRSRYRCPICRQWMVECQYKIPFSLMIDACANEHGVYFEAGEFERAIALSQ